MALFGAVPSQQDMWKVLRTAGGVLGIASTYVSATGTAGVDNTAQTVVTVVIPTNTLQLVGSRLHISTLWRGDTGAAITTTVALNGVTLSTAIDTGGTGLFTNEVDVHYIDSTHANILARGAYPATGAGSGVNVAGFSWNGLAQNLTVAQNAIASNHIVVFAVIVDFFPTGVLV